MLMVHSLAMPFLASYLVASRWIAMTITLFVTSAHWSLLYIPVELDHPFGDDKNDFNMNDMQHSINSSLLTLLHPLAQRSPGGTHSRLTLVSSQAHIQGIASRDLGVSRGLGS